MGMLGSVVLIILGAVAAEDVLLRLRPGLRFYVNFFAPLTGHLGVGAVLYGLFLTLKMLAYLGFVRFAPVVFFAGLLSGLDCIALGLLFGRKTAQRWIEGEFIAGLLRRAEPLEQILARHRTTLGLAGVALGIFGIALNLFT